MPPLTGLVGMYGAEITHAGLIACAEVNESGGVLGRPLELVIEDDGSLPDSALRAAAKLVDHHRCCALIGNLLSNSRIAVAYDVAEPRRTPYLNFSFYEGSILSHYFFHFAALPNQQIDRMIPYMRDKYGPRMFFAGNNYEWPRGSIDAAKRALIQAGGEAVGEEYCPIGASSEEIEHLLDQVAASQADVFVPYFAGEDQIHLLNRFTQKGLKSRMAVVMGHYDEVMASMLAPEVRAGFYSSNTYFMTVDTPENRSYLARLSRQAGVTGLWPHGNGILTNFGEGAYLCVKAFAKAANQAGSLDADALIGVLETISVSGPQGTVQMEPVTHHAQVNTYLSRCESDGSFSIIERFGAIPPALPERYRHLRISKMAGEQDIYLQSRMIAQMTEGLLLVRAVDGDIVYANPAAGRLFGFEGSDLTGRHVSALFASSDRSPEEIAVSIGNILSRKGVWDGETENVSGDGRRFWCAVSASMFTHPRYGEVWMMLHTDITERKRAEEALRLASSYARSLIEASLDPLVTISAEGRITDVNRATEEATGYSRSELVGTDFSNYFTEPAKARAGYQEAFAKGFVTDYPLSLQHSSGSVMEVLYNASVYKNDNGEIAGVFAAARDITERNRAEGELRAASRYARSLIEASRDPLVTISPEGKITDVNAATEKATGRTRAELVGTDFSDYFTEPDSARAGYNEVFAKGFVTDYALSIRHRDGHVIDVLYNASVYRDEGGKVLGVFAAARDVTERKRAEEALHISEMKFRTLVESSTDWIWEVDERGRYTYSSPQVRDLLGYLPEEIIGKTPFDLMTPDEAERLRPIFGSMVAERKPFRLLENANLHRSGRVVHMETSGVPIFDDQGALCGYRGIDRDITERIKAENEIRELNRDLERRVAQRTAQLSEANQELESFAYSVSHDLRVPLRAIDGFSRIVIEEYEGKLDAEGQRLLSVVRDNTRKMAQLIDDILAFSRTGRAEIKLAATDMEYLAREAMEQLRPAMSGREVSFAIKPLPHALADRSMMARVFANLLGNAVKFSKPKSDAQIEVGATSGKTEDTFYVKDNGVGFDMRYADKLFGVFQRLHSVAEFEGTGIGLAIVKRIVVRHGGRVWAEGKVGEGATIYFTLPKKETENG